uniref:Uncharacterized protein n=1 Tax=viral metagenome TaxID=1070528 RepID=A0A6C0D502_9ZZZZ
MASQSNTFDFTGLFSIQNHYLADLSALTQNGITPMNYLNGLRTGLNDLYNRYNTTLPASSSALDRQHQMIRIIDTEKTRLDNKKTGIDNAYTTQQRLIELNESYRQKNMKYINILIIIIITIVIYLALLIIDRTVSFIPSVVMDSLKTLLFMITFIIICIMIAQINKRDPMDYQKLLFVAPTDMSNNNTNTSSTDASYNTANGTDNAGCRQSECCSDETEWNNDLLLCIPREPPGGEISGFTLSSQICGNNNCKKSEYDNVKYIPYTPYEFDSYVKI